MPSHTLMILLATNLVGLATLAQAEAQSSFRIRGFDVRVVESPAQSPRKQYQHSSTQAQRDRPSQAVYARAYSEPANMPFLRSGNRLLDAAFALAMQESKDASVNSIRDGAFQNGQSVDCRCFETGELWTYVWTRDSAYAADLGLSWVDPIRTRDTLLFKISRARQGSPYGQGLEIVQDTGSGGSWPISTDRVVWALGADRVLESLDGEARSTFLNTAYEALSNTLEADRRVVFDQTAGLYRGEQSFLDWREQTYPSWTQNDVKAIGTSKALSTNVLHMLALETASRFAYELGDTIAADRYEVWAKDLRTRIRSFFWLPKQQLFASMSSATQPSFPLEKYDLLGLSLAVLSGLTTQEEAQQIFNQYPIYRAGPPVIHPQLPATTIYHNRSVWPFVTAYAMKAAAKAQHAPFVTQAMLSLWESASLNLSHMENLDMLSGLPFVEDGPHSGPVVNSRRQLWSVAAFISMMTDGIFGIQVSGDKLSFRPALTLGLARSWLPGASIRLQDLSIRGHKLQIRMRWSAVEGQEEGFFRVKSMRLNDQLLEGPSLSFAQLASDNQIDLELETLPSSVPLKLNRSQLGPGPALSNKEYKQVFAPLEPRLSWQDSNTLRVERRESNPTRWSVYRNGQLLATDLTEESYRLPEGGFTQACYTATQTYAEGGLVSHPSPELCQSGWVREYTAAEQSLSSLDRASRAQDHGRIHFNDWGWPSQQLGIEDIGVPRDGRYQFELAFANAFGPINTGITAAVKSLVLSDLTDGTVQEAVVWMPHQLNWDLWAWSSSANLVMKADHRYRLRIKDARNMSYLQHFDRYTGGQGGVNGPLNRINISGVRLTAIDIE